MPRIINTADPLPKDKLGQLALYNGMDTLTLYEIRDGLRSQMSPLHSHIYDFEMDLQSALLEMSLNGIRVDTLKRKELITSHEAEKKKIESHIHRLCEAIGYYDYYKEIAARRFADSVGEVYSKLPRTWAQWLDIPVSQRRHWKVLAGESTTKQYQKSLKEFDRPFNPNSSTQKLRLFYHFFGIDTNEISTNTYPDFLPPWGRTKGHKELRTRSTNGEYTPSADRDSLERLQDRAGSDSSLAAYWSLPFVKLCLYHADLAKTLQFLNCRLENGMFYSAFGAVTETGRLSSKKSNYNNLGWNSQNVTPPLRVIFTCPMGWKLAACDYEQIESRMVAARCFLQFGATNYIAATESGDLHSLACSMVWEDLPWPEDFTISWLLKHGSFPKSMVKAAKKIANQEFYRGKSRRDVSKTLGHGSNYFGKPPQMAKQSHIDLKLVEHYQGVYFSIFPEIRQWHNWIIEQVQVYQEYTTIFGRPRHFFGRPSDDATIREAIAHDGQSPAADYTNTALLLLHKATLCGKIPIELFLQKHDEIGVRFREPDERTVVTQMKEIMEQHYILTAPDGRKRNWSVPVEALVGWNLSHRVDYDKNGKLEKPINPDGLVEWEREDDRVRERDPFDLGLKPRIIRGM